ncbi:hypothetical protein PM082_024372 [Marasmius tenuissimus]|nr:hypothetical protein PM082_024372 [Marasmius tenuissimus]
MEEDPTSSEGCKRQSSAVAAESRLTNIYASGFEDSQVQSQEWVQGIEKSPTIFVFDGIKTEVDVKNAASPEAESVGADKGLGDVAGLNYKIQRMESTIAHFKLLNKFLTMNKNRATFAKERAEEKLLEAQDRCR